MIETVALNENEKQLWKKRSDGDTRKCCKTHSTMCTFKFDQWFIFLNSIDNTKKNMIEDPQPKLSTYFFRFCLVKCFCLGFLFIQNEKISTYLCIMLSLN